MAGYTKYLFGLQDTMTSGLTFDSVDKVLVTYNNNTITLPVKTDSVTGDQWYSLSTTTNTNESTTLNFVFNKFIQYAGYGPVTVTVYYKAHLNEKAYVGASSNNINSVQAVYSNSPVWIPEGDNWNPDDPFHNQPVTTTTKKDAYVYTTSLKLQKRATGGVTPLSGAQFKIEGGSTYNAMFYVEEFVASGTEGSATRVDNKTYYKLTGDKGYTETAPTETTASSYALGEGKTYKNPDTYYLIQKVQTNSGEPANITCTTGPDGNIEINGLGAGEYTITEVSAPAGYSKLVNPIQVKIEFGEPESAGEGCTWTYSKCTDGTKRGDKPNYQGCANPITIINEAGSSLPSTGGIGTTIFYVVGSILVLGACIALITRRRMSKSSK
jgi:fimbrial isopeptide formation D2 family protein/LPXTG-motif cell wall-anchored protein